MIVDFRNLKILIIVEPENSLRIRGNLKEIGALQSNIVIFLEKDALIDYLKSEKKEIDLVIIDSEFFRDDIRIYQAMANRIKIPKTIVCLRSDNVDTKDLSQEIVLQFNTEFEYIDYPINKASLEKAINILFFKK